MFRFSPCASGARRAMVCAFVVAAAFPVLAGAQAEAEATHQALRAIKDSSLEALSKGDVASLLDQVHPNAVVTAENGQVVRGRDGLEKFYKQMLEGPESPLEGFAVSDFEIDELSILYGDDTAIAFGSVGLEYLARGDSPLKESARWSAALVFEDERWLIASFHTSVDFTSSELMGRAVQKSMLMSGGGALVVGIVIGFLVPRRRK